MKKPQKTTNGAKTLTTDAAKAGPDIRKTPANIGVIDSVPVGAGRSAQAGQPGEVRPVGSTLVGDSTDGAPAASKKADDLPDRKSDMPKVDHTAAKQIPMADQATDKPAPVAVVPVRKTGFWPVAFGGVVAAGLGAAATIYALPHLPARWLPADESVTQETPDQQSLIDAAAQAGRQAAEQVIAAAPAPTAAALPDDLLARLEALEEQIAALAQPSDAVDATPSSKALDALRQRLDEQQARLEELVARPTFDPEAATILQQQIEVAAAEAQSGLEAARAQTQELQDAAADSTRRAEAVAAIAALQTALDAGVTPDQAREALETAGLETPDALKAEIPSLIELQTDFPEAARAALRASLRETSATGQGNLLSNFLRAQTGARSVAPRDGDDADAVLSRAEAQVRAGRINDALSQMQSLPEAALAAPAMADWASRATAYSRAQAALTDLSSGTN